MYQFDKKVYISYWSASSATILTHGLTDGLLLFSLRDSPTYEDTNTNIIIVESLKLYSVLKLYANSVLHSQGGCVQRSGQRHTH